MTTRLRCTLLRSLWMIDQTGGIEYGIIPGRLRGVDTTSGPKLSRCHWSDSKKKRKRGRMYCTHLAPGALEEHPVLSGPALQMSSPGTARLDPHCHSLPSSSPPHSLTSLFFFDITWKKRLHTAFNLPLSVVSGFAVVRRYVCGEEVTAAGSYVRRCWRANGGARLLPFSSGSISSRLGSTMWLKPLSRQKALHNLFPVNAFKNK